MIFEENLQNKSSPTFLVTTDIESTWAKDESIIFLGTWCLRYSRKECWESLNYSVFPYHWDYRQQIASDFLYINTVYEKLLIELARVLNKIHRVNYSVRYWLLYFIQVYFDRWQMLQRVSKKYPNLSMIRVAQNKTINPSQDTEEFIRQIQESSWNEIIYAEIAEKHTNIKVHKIDINSNHVNPESSIKLEANNDLLTKKIRYINLSNILDFLATKRIFRGMGIAVDLQYLKKFEYFKLSILLRQVPMRGLRNYTRRFEPDQSQRNWTLIFDYEDVFTKAVSSEIPRFLPVCFLEGYSKLSQSALDLKAITNPKIIVADNAFIGDERWKLWAANNCENGCKLIISQHGGHYGTGAWSSSELHEIAISDRFISWGWKRINEKKIVSAPAPKLIGNRIIKTNKKGTCLQVTASLERQSGLLHSFPIASQFELYLNDQIKFALSLSNEVRQKLIVRLFPIDFNWDIEQRWNDQAPGVVKNLGDENINLLMNNARICVATYNATFFLESMTRNVPTCMFWNPVYWELNENAAPYYNLLRQASLLFDDPVSCASHISSIWGDVENWWRSSLVQKAVDEFLNEFALVGKKPIRKLKRALTNWEF